MKSPSASFMMFALWMAVTRARPLSRAYLKAYSACFASVSMKKRMRDRLSEFFPFFLDENLDEKNPKVKKKTYHARRGRAGDDLERLDDSRNDLVLEARVLAWRWKEEENGLNGSS